MAAQVCIFPIPEKAIPFRILNAFVQNGQLWICERDLLSLLWLEKIPRHYYRNGDRELKTYKGRTSFFVKEEVFWRIQWNGSAESPHLNWLAHFIYDNGNKLDAMPRAKRRSIERKERP